MGSWIMDGQDDDLPDSSVLTSQRGAAWAWLELEDPLFLHSCASSDPGHSNLTDLIRRPP